jgi:hypothetical protein
MDAHFLSSDKKRIINAGPDTFFAEIAFFLIDVHGSANFRYGTLRASGYAGPAIYSTSGLIQKEFGLWFYAFRIVTPLTTERAPLKKNGCSYAGAVMDSVSLDIEDHSFGHLDSSEFASDAAWL